MERWLPGNDFVPNVHNFTAQSGIQVNTDGFSMLDYYRLFFTDELVNSLVTETNRYADEQIRRNANRGHRRRSRDHQWVPVTPEEMHCFFGITFLTGITKRPSTQLYWSKDPLYLTPAFSAAMNRDRYMLILKFLHFSNNAQAPNAQDPNRDRLYKIRPIIDYLNNKFQTVYTPYENIALDETLLLWKGRLSFRQYMPLKRSRFGVKIYNLCEASGYTYKFRIYTGKTGPVDDVDRLVPDAVRDFGVVEKLTVYMVLPLLDSGYNLFVDNFYTTVRLFRYLHSRQTNACGTVRKNRIPRNIADRNLQVGEMASWKLNELLCVKFRDKKDVFMLSTLHPSDTVAVRRRGRDGGQLVNKPRCITQYNQNMGAVDKVDQMLQPYTFVRKTMKWYRKVMFHIFQVAALNAFILYSIDHNDERPPKSYLQFLEGMITEFVFENRVTAIEAVRREPTNETQIRLTGRHYVKNIPSTENKQYPMKRCRVCYHKGIKRKETRFYCPQCPSHPGLCFNPSTGETDCFELWHTKKNLQ